MKEKRNAYTETGCTIPRQGLDHRFESNIVANEILIACEDEYRHALKHTWKHGDGGVGSTHGKSAIDRRPAFGPCFGFGFSMKCSYYVRSLYDRI
jgi:hypothetical protein